MIVSAPSAEVRRMGFANLRSKGIEVRTAEASTQPGCIALTRTDVPSKASAQSSDNTTCARFDSAKAAPPSYSRSVQ